MTTEYCLEEKMTKHAIMFDRRPVFASGLDLGIRCYNKNTSATNFHYGVGKTHREAVSNWRDTAAWKAGQEF